MAVHLNSAAPHKGRAFYSDSMRFQRKKSRMKPKKIQKKKKIRARHILSSLILICCLFLLAQQSYLFLITWDSLNVKTIEINCDDSNIFSSVSRFLNQKNLGNMLLLNISELQDSLKERPLIKDIHIRKIFPSTLRVTVYERVPAALIRKDKIFMIDREGILIREVASAGGEGLPLLIDSADFRTGYREKLELAWECLDSLSDAEKGQISTLDVSRGYKMIVTLRDSAVKLFLDRLQFADQLAYFQDIRGDLRRFGELEYVDLRFIDRIYIKNKPIPKVNLPNTMKGEQ